MGQKGDLKGRTLISVKELKSGMYVDELDRPWIETPYLLQGLLIKSQEDIDELARYCKHVYIDVEKKEPSPPPVLRSVRLKSSSPQKDSAFRLRPKKLFVQSIPEEEATITPFHGNEVYVNKRSMEEELPNATKVYKKAEVLIGQIQNDLTQSLSLNFNAAKSLVTVVVSSIVSNPDAMLLLNSFKKSHSTEYNRALNTSVFLIAFGRHLCLPAADLALLGLGGLLMDVGEVKLSKESQAEDTVFKVRKDASLHVIYGEEILAKIPGIPQEVMEITLQHHEREDGSGYPNGLSGNQLSNYARMAAIVDCYEKMVSQGIDECSPPLTPFEGLQMLWDWTRRWLNASLVQRFAHCIGLFPVGSLVELNSGEVALVLSHSRSNRLRPKVMLLLDTDKNRYNAPRELDLGLNDVNPKGVLYEITRDLEPDAYGIDPKEFYI